MTHRRRVTIETRGRSVVVRGWRSGDLLEEAGIKAVFSGAVGGWMVASKRLPDLLAFAERRNLSVDGVRSTDTTVSEEGRTQCGHPLIADEDGDVPMWPGGGDAA